MFHLVYISNSQDLWDDPFSGSLVLFSVIESCTVRKISCFCWAGCFSLCTLCSLVHTAWHNRPSIPDNKTHQPYMGLFGALTQQALRSTVCVQIVFVLTVHSCKRHSFQGVRQVKASCSRMQTWGLNPMPFLLEVDHPNHCPALTLFSCVFAVVFSQGDLPASQHERRSVLHHQ